MQFREDKTTQAACIFIKYYGGKMEFLRLMKLLYLADREMLLKYGDPITYDGWVSTDQGPALDATYDLIRPNSDQGAVYRKRYICTSNCDVELTSDPGINDLSHAEEHIIDEVCAENSKLNNLELLDKMHGLPEWEDPHGDSAPIPIERVLKANNFSADDVAAIVDHIGEQEVLYRVLESLR